MANDDLSRGPMTLIKKEPRKRELVKTTGTPVGFTTHEPDKPTFPDLWFKDPELVRRISVTPDEWFVEKLRQGTAMLRNCIDIDPDVRGGVPVIKDTRIPVSRILAELADGLSIEEVADDFEIDPELLKNLLDGMASCVGRPFHK
jgi:uncharacterized protein (DUF433 family)